MAQEQSIPQSVLVVADDESVRGPIRDKLRGAGYEVATAADGMEALTLLGRQWFPVVITDRTMPVIDGVEFVQRLRAIAVAPVYVIMLTPSSDPHDYERGYCAGVDHYLPRASYERELLARTLTALNAIRRRQLSPGARASGPITVDLESGAHTARHLVGRLHAEIAHASRASQDLSVVSVCLEPPADATEAARLTASVSQALLHAVRGAVRPKLDWVARLPAGRDTYRLAIVMPTAGEAEIAAVEQGIRNAFVHAQEETMLGASQLTVGYANLRRQQSQPTALELLGEAERNRRGGQGSRNTLQSVQRDSTDSAEPT